MDDTTSNSLYLRSLILDGQVPDPSASKSSVGEYLKFEPLAPQFKFVFPQPFSPFFNGTIPSEIRAKIFEYVLTENETLLYSRESHYSRPGYRFQKGISTSLLQTCRRVYLETHHIPLVNKDHVFWHYHGPPINSYRTETHYFSRFRPDQLAFVRKVHLFTEQCWLEGSLRDVCQMRELQGIQKMKVTLRRGDWWFWKNSAELALTPQRRGADVKTMKEDWRAEDKGETIPWDVDGWGCSFKHISALKELEMEFETSIYEEAELLQIVERAKKWQFPMKNHPESGVEMVLSSEGEDIGKSTWRGPMCVWSRNCPECGTKNAALPLEMESLSCEVCKERKGLMNSHLGPLLVVFSLKWKLTAAGKR